MQLFIPTAILIIVSPTALARLSAVTRHSACAADGLKHRVQLQNKLADVCVDMCKQTGSYPDRCACPGFVNPDVVQWDQGNVCVEMCKEIGAYPRNCACPKFRKDTTYKTPGVMGWDELLTHMDNESRWGKHELEEWKKKQPSFLGLRTQDAQGEEACLSRDLQHRTRVQNKLASGCVDMCKEVGASRKCTCPAFAAAGDAAELMTWSELFEHIDNFSEWGHRE